MRDDWLQPARGIGKTVVASQAPVKQIKLGIVKSRLVPVSLTLMLLDLCAVDELFLFIFRIGLEYSLI